MKRILLLLLALAAALPAVAADEWTEVRSPHVAILTDTGFGSGRAIGLRFEIMRSLFASLLLKNQIRSNVPFYVIAFKNTREFQQALPQWQGKPASGGVVLRSPDIDYALLDLSDPKGYDAIAHDYAHSLLDANTAPMPLWYDEGMAELFGGITLGDKEATLGHPPAYLEEALAAHRLLPTAEFLAITPRSPLYTEATDRRSLYYAQSWLMVSWALANHRLEAVSDYARMAMLQHVPPAEAFSKAFGISLAEFDKQLAAYAAAPRQTYFPLPAGLNDESTYTYGNRKVPVLDAQVAIADFHLHSKDYAAQGVTELQSIVRQDPNNAGANRSLGYAALEHGDFAKAADLLKQSIDYSTGDARPYYYMAFVIGKKEDVQGGGSASFQMKSNLVHALDLDPTYADAWSLLALVYQIDGKTQEAIDDMLKAIALAPRNDRNRFQLARLYASAKRWDEAQALLDYLKDSPDPEVAADVAGATTQMQAAKTAPQHAARLDERARPSTYDNPKWQLPESVRQRNEQEETKKEEELAHPPKPDPRPILFLKGTLVDASCAPSGNATLTVASGKKKLRLVSPDYKKIVVIGADSFSCDWKGRTVSINYRASSPTTGDLVSLEVD
ncbi:MAG TPA: tetratricopeptide repeat protein [Terriglobales bacterium]|nr:tetratricopeptide repeat protein [Terriglobales bacterium]